MKCLVTGAAGFIGSHLVDRLLDEGNEVVGIDGFVDNYSAALKRANVDRWTDRAGFALVEGMIEDLDLDAVLGDVQQVFHLAALPGVRSSWGDRFDGYSSHNVLATQRLLEAARKTQVERLVYASSSSVYGDAAELPMVEGAREKPFSPYGVTKLAAEHLVRLYHRNYGTPAVSVRYFTVYGPRQRPDMAIQRFLIAARDDTPITLFGNGEQTRDFTYVADTVEATVRAARQGSEGAVYNVGGGSTVTLNDLIEAIEEVTGRRLLVERQGVQRGDVRDTCADTTLAAADLGFAPSVPLREGVRKQWEFIQAADRAVTVSS